MREGKTSSGFEFAFDEKRLNDMRLVDALADVVNVNVPELKRIIALSQVIERLVGADTKEKLYEHIASYNDGLVPSGALEKELQEILTAEPGNTTKN